MSNLSLTVAVEHRFASSGFHLRAELQIASGWTVLFGASGAGKSSLLRAVAGLLRPQQGRMLLGSEVWLDNSHQRFVPAEKRNVGYLAQAPALFPHLTVAQNIAFGQRYAASPADASRLTTLFHCDHLLTRRPAQLSGGEQQRVALARALASNPSVLLLDEPFRGLDAELRDAILDDLQSYLAERPIPVLAVSHDPVEILSLRARVLRMENGAIVQSGPAEQLLAAERQRILSLLQR